MQELDKIKRRELIYVNDLDRFRDLWFSVRAMWFKRYKINLTKGDVVMISLSIAKEVLEENNYFIVSKYNQNLKPSFRYGRLSR